MLAAFALRQRPQVGAAVFQQVVGDEAHRRVGQQLLAHRLAADALLQHLEARRRVAAGQPDQQLTVQHRAIRQGLGQGHDFGETVSHKFLTARPDPHLPAALDHLRADAVVLPLHQPIGHRPQHALKDSARCLRFGLQCVRKKERVGLAGRTAVTAGRGQQRGKPRRAGGGAGVRPAHQALRQQLGVQAGLLRQGALHQQLAHAHAQPTADELDEQESACSVQPRPVAGQPLRLLWRRQAAQRQQPVLHPHGQADGFFASVFFAPRRRQHQRDGFSQVANGLVTLVKQPVVHPRQLAGRVAQDGCRHQLARLAASQEVQRPGGVFGQRTLKIMHKGCNLVASGGAGVQRVVEVGKGLHRGMMPRRRGRLVRCCGAEVLCGGAVALA